MLQYHLPCSQCAEEAYNLRSLKDMFVILLNIIALPTISKDRKKDLGIDTEVYRTPKHFLENESRIDRKQLYHIMFKYFALKN